ncbi:MAG: hypothetical protein LBM93_06175 [Oscillospiraceae bacterium]|jgi:hypothetical protein|nr:hypothetical protein [Oscillospiraceae bacterium]
MKHKIFTAICIILIVSLVGCGKNSDDNQSSDNTSGIYDSSAISTSDNLIPIDILSLDKAAVIDIINSQSNFKTGENIDIQIPEKTPVLEFISRNSTTQNFENYYKEYKSMFEYLFPNHTLNENYLFYNGGSSKIEYDDNGNKIQDFNKVKDKYEDLVSGKEGDVSLLYDETWLRDVTDWNSQVCFEMGTEIGAGYTVINKGKTVEICGKIGDFYPCLESYDPVDHLELVASYSPDSTESYKLSDKEIPINEAVDFFENYINNLPYPSNANLEISVIGVDVYKVNNNIFGYNFLTTGSYQGIAFEHLKNGTMTLNSANFGNYLTSGGNAFMVESNDVDILYGYYRVLTIENTKQYNKVINFETATEKISSNLSDKVIFDVQKTEFIYRRKLIKTAEGFVDVEGGYPNEVVPVWKFTLYNPNDGLIYLAYVDAKDGENFRYYTVKSGD